VIKTKSIENEPRIYGVKIYHDGDGCYGFIWKHTGQFTLKDYQELELEVKSVKLVRRE